MKMLYEKDKSINEIVDEIYTSQVDSDFVYDKLTVSEDNSARNNYRIYGISESKYET